MTRDEVQKWLDSYIAAWRSNDPGEIGALFSSEAVYSFRPTVEEEHSVTGRDQIVARWLKTPEDPATWDASYEPYAVEGQKAVAVGWTSYEPQGDDGAKFYDNAFLLRFDEAGACAEFREFYFSRS